jgi:uncharacterized protein YdcH (DUF465 family)
MAYEQEDAMSLENHIKRIIGEHADLDRQIDRMERTGRITDPSLPSMKKQRLMLKDEIRRLQDLRSSKIA